MKNEDYSYMVNQNNVQYQYKKEYKNSSSDWFSILNFSIGYEKKLHRVGSFRFEPYLKLPLKGVGIGSMPISSMGVIVGFTIPVD